MQLSVPFILETFQNAFRAVPLTLSLAIIPFLVGSIFAFLLALAQINKVFFWGRFSKAYVSVIRGTPTVVLVLLLYNSFMLMLFLL